MLDPSTSPDKPTTLMRVVLATLTVATAVVTAGPLILISGVVAGCILFAGAAVALAHTGALEPATFAPAQRAGIVGLVAFFVAAFGYRQTRHGATGLTGAISRQPAIAAVVALPLLSAGVAVVAWDRPSLLPEPAGAIFLDDLYFFSFSAVALVVVSAHFAARGVFRWAVAERFRAGLVSGMQMMLLAVVFVVASVFGSKPLPAASAESHAPTRFERDLTAAVAASGVESERRWFAAIDGLLEGRRPELSAASVVPSPPTPDDEIRACIEQLTADIEQVRSTVGRRFGLADDDARDLVHDALLNVCNAHVRKRYAKLGAVLQCAAERRAVNWARRRKRDCELDPTWPVCLPRADDVIRFEQEDAILDGAICNEDNEEQRIIWMRTINELSFAEIGAKLGRTETDARTRYNNSIKRIRKRLADACGP